MVNDFVDLLQTINIKTTLMILITILKSAAYYTLSFSEVIQNCMCVHA